VAEQSDINRAKWLPVILAAMAGVFALFHPSRPLTSQRPSTVASTLGSLVGDQRFPARLWEDPFDASTTAQIPPNSLEELLDQLDAARSNLCTNVIILGILVEGSNYPEDLETRLRLRYATQWAFLEPSWRPADRAHLGCFKVRWPTGRELSLARATKLIPRLDTWPGSSTNSLPLKHSGPHHGLPRYAELASYTNSLAIPFEWFHHFNEGAIDRAVLLMWLKEEEFTDFPISRLLELDAALNRRHPDGPLEFKVVGPRSSDTLRRMAWDQNQRMEVAGLSTNAERLRKGLAIYSPTATAPDFFLLGNLPNNAAPTNRSAVTERITADNVTFTNLTVLDTEMVAALADELSRRRVPPFNSDSYQSDDNQGQPSIALLYEGDTLFSRCLVNCFAALCNASHPTGTNGYRSVLSNALLTNADDLGLITAPAKQKRPNSNYVAYAYLRGLDGSPGTDDQKPAKDKSGTKQENAAVSTRYNQEQAEGNAQFDYARRISRELKERIPSLKAVGIFGSDPYDKLTLLQALRQEFPDAIYFTTELDNRYLGPKAGSLTRNMVVVSAFPLDYDLLTDKEISTGTLGSVFCGRRFVEFRNSIQTAVYCAVRQALGDRSIDPSACGPLLYEVGRSQLIPLPDTEPWKHFQDYWWPPCAGSIFFRHWVPTLLIIACSAFLLVRLVHPLYRGLSRLRSIPSLPHSWLQRVYMIEWRRKVLLLIVGFGGLLFITYCAIHFLWLSAQPDGEPFRWAEGVSIWPTELARLFAICLVILMIIYYWYQHRIWRVKLWARFVEGVDLQQRPFLANLGKEAADMDQDLHMRNYRTVLSRMRPAGRPLPKGRVGLNRWQHCTRAKVNSRELLTDYFDYGLWWKRMLRVILYAGLFGLLGYALIAVLGHPTPPTRGGYTWDDIILKVAIGAFCILTFYVVDATRLTQRLIKRLCDAQTSWDGRYLARLMQQTNLQPADLAGYADVQFVAAHTQEVSQIIFMPFIVLCVMLLSRTQYFDRWPWPTSLLLILALSATIALLCAFTLRGSANKVRQAALEQLENAKVGALAATPPNKGYTRLLQRATDKTKGLSIGAYAPWALDNAVLAVLLSSGGAALLTILDYLFSLG
jgi:hypothetical protein